VKFYIEKPSDFTKTILGILLGIVVSCFGHFINHADRFTFVYKTISPGYLESKLAYENLLTEGAVLNSGDAGFDEFSKFYIETLFFWGSESGDRTPIHESDKEIPIVAKIESVSVVFIYCKEGPRAGETSVKTNFKFYFENYDPCETTYDDLRSVIDENYLGNKIYELGDVLFYIGLAITFLSPFLTALKKQ